MDKVIIVTSFTSEKMILKYKDYPLIGVEKGIKKILDLNLKPVFAISDFDTFSLDEITNIDFEIEKLPSEKDYSDTEYALIRARELYKDVEIVILGSLSKRYDHSHALLLLLKKYSNVVLEDENNAIYCFEKGDYGLFKEDYSYLGIFGFPSCKVSLEGVYYKVENLELSFVETKAISNSFINDYVDVHVLKGTLLLVLSKD